MANDDLFQEVINGAKAIKEFKFEGVPNKIPLRALTNKELGELKALEKGDKKGKIKMEMPTDKKARKELKEKMQQFEQEIDYKEMVESQYKVMKRAVCISADILEETYDAFPSKLAKDIFEKVVEISQITDDDLALLKEFRKDE